MPTPELVEVVARAIEQALDSSDPNALAKAALKAHEEWLAEQRLKLAHIIAGHIGKPFEELKPTEVARKQCYDYGESQETILDIVDDVLAALAEE